MKMLTFDGGSLSNVVQMVMEHFGGDQSDLCLVLPDFLSAPEGFPHIKVKGDGSFELPSNVKPELVVLNQLRCDWHPYPQLVWAAASLAQKFGLKAESLDPHGMFTPMATIQ